MEARDLKKILSNHPDAKVAYEDINFGGPTPDNFEIKYKNGYFLVECPLQDPIDND